MDFVDDESVPTIQCSRCCEWHHRPCVIGLKFPDQCFTCPDCGPWIFEESEAASAVDSDEEDEEQVIAKQKAVMQEPIAGLGLSPVDGSAELDSPLIVKCTFDKWHKSISFSSARNCSHEVLRHKVLSFDYLLVSLIDPGILGQVEEIFSLSTRSYAMAYKDDDGEIIIIATNDDLIEAIRYFGAGDDASLSSAASILSGRSFGSRRITVRVIITVDYDGPSLSASLASLLSESSESDNVSLSLGSQDDPLGGNLALERDARGKDYHAYTSGSSISHFWRSALVSQSIESIVFA